MIKRLEEQPEQRRGAVAPASSISRLAPQYDPALVEPMRQEVARLGIRELTTPDAVDVVFRQQGHTLVCVNSGCGSAASSARPALALALTHPTLPGDVVTVFAGMEHDAVAQVRKYFLPHPPSSPQIALLEGGMLRRLWQRQDLEGREPAEIARSLTDAFDEYLSTPRAG